MDDFKPVINSDTIELGIEYDHEMVERWLKAIGDHSSRSVRNSDSDSIKSALELFLKGLQSLQEEGYFQLETQEYYTENELQEAREELEDKIEELKASGASVREQHPELESYFDDIALGDIYQDFNGSRYALNCYSREPDFIIYVFGLRLAKLFSRGDEFRTHIAGILLVDLIKNKVKKDDVEALWNQGCELLEQFRNQEMVMSKLTSYAKHRASLDKQYVTHGAPASITRKSPAEAFSELYALCRKTN